MSINLIRSSDDAISYSDIIDIIPLIFSIRESHTIIFRHN